MEIILAKTAGFCMGVKRAMQIASQTALKNESQVYTCGPLIHNPQAVEYLKKQGVESLSDWRSINSGTLIIRAHGMPAQDIEEMKARGLNIVDATCPHVVTSQRQIKKYADLGYFIVIIGDKDHPEILSLQSFADQQRFRVISSLQQAKELDKLDQIMIIAQTTFNAEEFAEIADALSRKAKQAVVCNSICQATSERQQEVQKLAANADAVIVVGGKASANTRRLAEIAASICSRTHHIETEEELEGIDLTGVKKLAITAGASTPDFITEKVIEHIRKKF